MQTDFNPIDDAINIRQFITKPKNLDQLIKIIAHRSSNQRQEISKEYKNKYQIELLNDFKKELSGNFQETVISLFYTPVDFDCYQLNKAMKGLGTNEDTLIEILSSRDNERIIEIKKRYIEMYNKTLVPTACRRTG